MKIYAKTDVGRKREMNQDYVYVTDKPVGPFPNLLVRSQTEWEDIKRVILRQNIP